MRNASGSIESSFKAVFRHRSVRNALVLKIGCDFALRFLLTMWITNGSKLSLADKVGGCFIPKSFKISSLKAAVSKASVRNASACF